MSSKSLLPGQYVLTSRFIDWCEQLNEGCCQYDVGEIVILVSIDASGYMRFEQSGQFYFGLWKAQQELFDDPIIVS